MLENNRRRFLLAVALVASAAIFAAAPSWAEVKVPATPEDHFALARKYKEKAEVYRKEAAEHREMAEAARKSPINAVENEKAADYHNFRGKELQGK